MTSSIRTAQASPINLKHSINFGQKNPYLALRKQALFVKPSDLGLYLSADKESTFGVILEFGTSKGSATITSYATGDASMYFSSGGGIIGGIKHMNVKNAAIDLVKTAQDYFVKKNLSNLDIPAAGHIKFHIITNRRIHSYDLTEVEATKRGSYWEPLFSKGNNVITQLRMVSQ